MPASHQRQFGEQLEPGCSDPEKRHIPSVKIDQNIGDKSKLSFYMSNYLYYANARADGLPAPITSQRNRKIFADTYQLHYDYTPTPTWVIHFGLGFVRGDHDDNYLPASLAFVPASIGLNGSYTTGMPVTERHWEFNRGRVQHAVRHRRGRPGC